MPRRSLLAVAIALVAACGGGDTTTETDTGTAAQETTSPAADETTPPADETAAGDGATVAVASSDLGEILVDGEGRTLYVFLNDEQGGPSTCSDQCATNWPPLTGEPTAGEGADDALLGTVERDDGATQATYDGWPLYYFAADQQPGDTNGQGVGDVWYVVDPSGEPIRDANAAAGEDDDGSMGY